MAKLTGLQIQKLLPKTNCKECGSNTCLAFAMKLAAPPRLTRRLQAISKGLITAPAAFIRFQRVRINGSRSRETYGGSVGSGPRAPPNTGRVRALEYFSL